VGEAPPALLTLVPGVPVRDLTDRPGRGSCRPSDRGLVVLGSDQTGFGPLDLARQLRRGNARVGAAPTGERDEKPRFAIEEHGELSALLGAAGAELGERQRVDGAGGDARVDVEALEAGAQLPGGPAGGGDGEDSSGGERAGGGLPGDPAGQDAGFSGSGAGEHGQWRGVADDRLTLVIVEADEDRVGVHDSDGTEGV